VTELPSLAVLDTNTKGLGNSSLHVRYGYLPNHQAWKIKTWNGRAYVQDFSVRTDPYAQFGPCLLIPLPQLLRGIEAFTHLQAPWLYIPLDNAYLGFPLEANGDHALARARTLTDALREYGAYGERAERHYLAVIVAHERVYPPLRTLIAPAEGVVEHVCAGCPHVLLRMFKPCRPGTSTCSSRYLVARQEMC